MKYIFLLSGDYVDLAKEEVASLFSVINFKSIDRLFTVNLSNVEEIKKSSKRLALTKSIYRILFECKINNLDKLMKKFDWNSVYKDSFCLRINYFDIIPKKKHINDSTLKNLNKKNIKTKYSEKILAGYIWNSIKNPKANLENPKTKIEIFIVAGKAYCGLMIYENHENFESRKPHLRPFPHPSSMHPKLARTLVNISGVEEILLDPFCGTGGFLIEAGLMNIKVVGYDISKNMADGCIDNLKYFKIRDYRIINKNAVDIDKKFDYVVTDLPYGLNSNIYLEYNKKSINQKSNKINLKINRKKQIKNIEKFYLKFLLKLRKTLRKKAVIIFPNYVNYRLLLKKSSFKIEKEFSIYVHRSLSRKIVKIR